MSCKKGLPLTEIEGGRELSVLFVCSITYSTNVLKFCSKAFTIVLTYSQCSVPVSVFVGHLKIPSNYL